MKKQELLDGLCEWEFRIKLKAKLEEGWEVVPGSVQIIPVANGAIERWFVLLEKEEDADIVRDKELNG